MDEQQDELSQEVDLEFEIAFLEGIVRADPSFFEAISLLAADYTAKGCYEQGLRTDQRLRDLSPDDPIVHYNLACDYSLLDRADEAIDALRRAVALGYLDFDFMASDPDLANVREDPRYRAILQQRKRR